MSGDSFAKINPFFVQLMESSTLSWDDIKVNMLSTIGSLRLSSVFFCKIVIKHSNIWDLQSSTTFSGK